MRIDLPWPPKELSPNARVHWRAAADVKADYKAACAMLAKVATKGWEPVYHDLHLTVTFHQPDMRKRDVDNMLASIKYGLDGVAQALGVDDRQFRPITVDWKRGKKPGMVSVEVEHVPL